MFSRARAGIGLLVALFSAFTQAQYPPPPQDMAQINASVSPGSSIEFKETTICETTPGVQSYSGYIHLPPTNLRPYPVSTFFWYFSARESPSTAPLALWLQGGPGVPSITAALGENGPCNLALDSKTTLLNPFSWNNRVNMLYIDQPVQVGFSYDTLINGTIDQLTTGPVFVNTSDRSSKQASETVFRGTFPSQNPKNTANTTEASTATLWEVMQVWAQDFPHTTLAKTGNFSVWTESYGGHYAPAMAEYFDAQNQAIAAGGLPGAVPLTLDTLGIVNGCIDMKVQMPFYPRMAYANTYDIQRINQSQYETATQSWPECEKRIDACRAADGESQAAPGTNKTVTDTCLDAYLWCFANVHDMYSSTLYNVFDITKKIPDSTVPKWAAGFLNTAETQAALGVPLNFTGESLAVAGGFNLTGDFVYAGGLTRMNSHLNRGGKLALVYGDADYQCNWLGGEAISLALTPSTSVLSTPFSTAGYANITTNESYTGGLVRQSGPLSFSRVFNAGHEGTHERFVPDRHGEVAFTCGADLSDIVPYYQPETALRIFERVMFGQDVSTGEVCADASEGREYVTAGPACVESVKNVATEQEKSQCYMWDVLETCDLAEKAMLKNGTGVIRDFVLQN